MSGLLEHSVAHAQPLTFPDPNLAALDQFVEIWVIDFEFGQDKNLLPDVRCLVAQELRSGTRYAYWVYHLQGLSRPPFNVDGSTLIVVFYGLAELGCFAQLGWQYPVNLVDLYTECWHKWNGVQLGGSGLIDVAKRLGINAPGDMHKGDMRNLAVRGGPYSEEEMKSLLSYCAEDVATTAGVFSRLIDADWFEPPNHLGLALLRGKYLSALADTERLGVPIDREMLAACRDNWGAIRKALIEELDQGFHVYDGETFKEARFVAYLKKSGIPWPRTEKGRPELKDDTFKERALLYPQIEPLRTLWKTLSQVRDIKLTVGADGRNRYMQSPFGTVTGRNNPSTTKAAFGLPRWLRGLVRPTERGTDFPILIGHNKSSA